MSVRLETRPWLTKNFAVGALDTNGLLGKTSGGGRPVDGSAADSPRSAESRRQWARHQPGGTGTCLVFAGGLLGAAGGMQRLEASVSERGSSASLTAKGIADAQWPTEESAGAWMAGTLGAPGRPVCFRHAP